MNTPDYVEYKGYQIIPAPYPLRDGGYSIHVVIAHHTGPAVRERPFTADGHFDREEDANIAAIEFGEQIIDGEVEGVSVEGL